MKKLIVFMLLAAALLGLAGCSRGEGAPSAAATATPAPTPDPKAVLAASDTDVSEAVKTHTPPASSTDLDADAAFSQAQAFVGRTLQELYAVIGQPTEEPVYAASETQEGAQEGTLTYDGFYVKTLRTADGETVQQVDVIHG